MVFGRRQQVQGAPTAASLLRRLYCGVLVFWVEGAIDRSR